MPLIDSSPPREYSAHRERQRRRILDAAENLFDEHGIDRVTMADIIAASGLRASTMYQYFPNKDEIVWAKVGEVFAEIAARVEKAVGDAGGGALAKITALLEVMADDLTNRPAQVRFMAQFDAMYARNWSVERLLALEDQTGVDRAVYLAGLIREGLADGSLRADLNPELTIQAVINAVIGEQRRLASLG